MANLTNQFNQTPAVGYLDLLSGPTNVVTGQVAAAQATPLVAGQTVKLVDDANALPNVVAALATDVAWGVACVNLKNVNFPAGQPLEIAKRETIMFMQASVAIGRGVSVSYDPTTNKVGVAASGAPKVGEAYDKAVNVNDIIRVTINPGTAA